MGLHEGGVRHPRRDEEGEPREDAGERDDDERAVVPVVGGRRESPFEEEPERDADDLFYQPAISNWGGCGNRQAPCGCKPLMRTDQGLWVNSSHRIFIVCNIEISFALYLPGINRQERKWTSIRLYARH